MVTVPEVTSRARLSTGPANVQLSPSIVPPAADYTGAGRQLLAAASSLMERQAALEEKKQAARNAVDLMKANTDAARFVNDLSDAAEKGGDFRNGVAQYDQDVATQIQQRAAAIADPLTREKFTAHAQGLAETRRVSLRDRLFKLEANDAQAALDDNLDTLAKARAAAGNNPAEIQRLDAAAAKAVKDMADVGYIERTAQVNLMQKYRGRGDRVMAEKLVAADPVRAERYLADPTNLPNLDPLDRTKLQERAGTLVDRAERRAIATEDRNQRRAEHDLKLQGDAAAKDLWSLHSPDPSRNRLTLDAIDQRKRELDPSEYRALRRAAMGEAVIDHAPTVTRLEPLLDQPGILQQLDAAMDNGELTIPTYRDMRRRAQQLQADDKPNSPYKSGRGFLEKALDPGQFGDDKFARQAQSLAQQRALADFDTWAEANPGVDRPAAMAHAQRLQEQYQNVAYNQMRITLPRPEGYTGAKDAVTQATIDQARALIADQLTSKSISNAEAARKFQSLENWEAILGRAPKPAPAATKGVQPPNQGRTAP